ncbi:type II secretion system protein [Sporosarcina sp. G11-34]|uniref:type II secretion system protein n=1 Tax=Sporosarcina sp. G11-34 TaxID=2849605 RepID=UPI0022A9F66A|nr:prepilin-type N-terminal cleavage/methylation domain-containing protein [Sporosarcina sp. G11-34]MCZ2259822.1 prepilin-type N-terminal cleavage/methylation domain-containing protein [Sporosarcina sp. G11-34]
MFKKFKKQINNEKGLTLIELLAVIVILAIVAAIAVPAIGNVINNSRDKAILAEASNILAGAKIAQVDNKCTTIADGSATCNKAELTNYVEGIELGAGDGAEKAIDGAWTITFAKLAEIKQTKFNSTISSNVVTENDLNTLLGN